MSGQKCPECGTWWAWPSEHRCPPITSTYTTSVHFTGIPTLVPRDPDYVERADRLHPGLSMFVRWFRWIR